MGRWQIFGGSVGWALLAVACTTERSGPASLARSLEQLTWSDGQTLKAEEPSQVGAFGSALALSGDLALIGAPEANGPGSGYLFQQSADGWVPKQRLQASQPRYETYFGDAVALSGDAALIGAMEDSQGDGEYEGAAYVFTSSGGDFTQTQKLVPTDVQDNAFFGKDVALSGDTALIGSNRGAYVFVRDGSSWKELQKLTSPTAADEFGAHVALDGDTALVGSWGEVDVFVRQAGMWTWQQTLLPADEGNNYFGTAVALAGDTAIVGAYLNSANDLSGSGSASLFTRHGTTWEPTQVLTSPDENGDWFGFAVALAGDRALIGADYHSKGGAAYIFQRAEHGFELEQEFIGTDQSGDNDYGSALALDDRNALVGAWSTRVDGFGQAGLAYAYSLPQGTGAGGDSGEGHGGETGAAGTTGSAGDTGTGEPPGTPTDAGTRPPVDAGVGNTHPDAGATPDASAPRAPDDASSAAGSGNEPADSGAGGRPSSAKTTTTLTEAPLGLGCSVGSNARRAPSLAWAGVLALLAVARRRKRHRY